MPEYVTPPSEREWTEQEENQFYAQQIHPKSASTDEQIGYLRTEKYRLEQELQAVNMKLEILTNGKQPVEQ